MYSLCSPAEESCLLDQYLLLSKVLALNTVPRAGLLEYGAEPYLKLSLGYKASQLWNSFVTVLHLNLED